MSNEFRARRLGEDHEKYKIYMKIRLTRAQKKEAGQAIQVIDHRREEERAHHDSFGIRRLDAVVLTC